MSPQIIIFMFLISLGTYLGDFVLEYEISLLASRDNRFALHRIDLDTNIRIF